MSSYTNIFGGNNINIAFPSYMSYTFSENLDLTWATSFVDNTNVTANVNDLDATEADLIVTLADATLVSQGIQIQFNNVGANPITINNHEGGEIAIIPIDDNNQYILYLQDNSTPAGTWGITHLGAGTSSADASVLAGLGTIALNGQINANIPGKSVAANYQILASDRGSIIIWTGGAGTLTLLDQVNGFPISINNQGSGVVTITTPDSTTIDGQSSFSLNPSESSSFIGVSGNWNSLGFGIESYFQANVLAPLDISGSATTTLTDQQSSRLIQQFTGTLTQNVTVIYPAAAGQWYVWNNTTGSFTVTTQINGQIGGIVIPQGEKVILYSDGTSMYNTPTVSTNAVFPDGNVGSPGIAFTSQVTTGFYRISSGLTGYASAGSQGLTLGGTTPGYALGISSGLSQRFYNTNNSNYIGFEAPTLTENTIWKLPPADATDNGQIIFSDAAGNLDFTDASYPISTTINQLLYSSADDTIIGLATANNGILITSAGGVPSIGNTLPIAVQQNITQLGTITSIGALWAVGFGGTGIGTTTAYGVLCGGTTATGSFQNAGTGTANQTLVSNGNAALPTWQPITNILPAATAANQRTGTSTSVYVNPNVQQFHNSAVKAWINFAWTGTNIVVYSSYNMNNPTRTSTGKYKLVMPNAMANANYNVHINGAADPATTTVFCTVDSSQTYSTTTFSIANLIYVPNFGYGPIDPDWVMVSVIGNM